MGNVGIAFCAFVVTALLLLGAGEAVRYRRAQTGEGELPYPRRRLVRRLASALIFVGLIGWVAFWPRTGPVLQLLMILLVFILIAMGMTLLWRDLKETSQSLVSHSRRVNEDFGESMAQLIINKPPQPREPATNNRPPDCEESAAPDSHPQPDDRRS
jgi:hypothetical protein